jgi:hypothetical protein
MPARVLGGLRHRGASGGKKRASFRDEIFQKQEHRPLVKARAKKDHTYETDRRRQKESQGIRKKSRPTLPKSGR